VYVLLHIPLRFKRGNKQKEKENSNFLFQLRRGKDETQNRIERHFFLYVLLRVSGVCVRVCAI